MISDGREYMLLLPKYHSFMQACREREREQEKERERDREVGAGLALKTKKGVHKYEAPICPKVPSGIKCSLLNETGAHKYKIPIWFARNRKGACKYKAAICSQSG